MVYAQNLGGDAVPAAGDRVQLMWRPEHTFAVNSQETSTQEEDA
jgi:hypothetical protein